VIFGLLDTFYDEQAPFFEVSTALQRIITALQRLRDGNVAVLLASRDVTLASKERNGLFPVLLRSMDRVFHMVEAGEGRHILNESAAFRPLPGNGKEKEMLMGRRALPAAVSAITFEGGVRMGRTVPTFTMVIQQEMESWGKFRRGLRREDQEALDDLFRAARLQLAGSAYAARPIPSRALPCACFWHSTG